MKAELNKIADRLSELAEESALDEATSEIEDAAAALRTAVEILSEVSGGAERD